MSVRLRQALACATASLLLAGAATDSARAGSFEQLDRGNDIGAWSGLFGFHSPIGASDSGRYAIVEQRVSTSPTTGFQRFWIRDIVSNISHRLGDDSVREIYGVDASESWALAYQQVGDTQSGRLVLLSTKGLPSRTIATFGPFGGNQQLPVYAAISGDGKTVAFTAYGYGLRTYNVVTGATTTITNQPTDDFQLGPRSLSDNGKVIAGGSGGYQGFAYVNGTKIELPSFAAVSPNGSTIVNRIEGAPGYAVRNVAAGTTVVRALPAGATYAALQWISVDGSRIVATVYDANDNKVPQQLNTATGAWSAFGGQFSGSLQGSLTDDGAVKANTISRNGLYAAVGYNPLSFYGPQHAALVDLAGGDLPGSQEALSASSYVGLTPGGKGCEEPTDGSINVQFSRPAPWLPAPRRATVRFEFNNGGGVKTETFASPETTHRTVVVPKATTKIVARVTVVDGTGRTLSTSDTTPVFCNW